MKPFDRYYTIFEGKDTIVETNPISGMYRVLLFNSFERFTCCKCIALSYIRRAEPMPAPALPQRIATAASTAAEAVLGRGSAATAPNGKLSTFARITARAMLFIIMLALICLVFEALFKVLTTTF